MMRTAFTLHCAQLRSGRQSIRRSVTPFLSPKMPPSDSRATLPIALRLSFLIFVPVVLTACMAGAAAQEYVIITPGEPWFEAWADSLRAQRTLDGVPTVVYTTAEIGETWTALRDFLADAYYSWPLPPQAVLLLGDVPLIPAAPWENMYASDNIYADVDGDDLPDFAVARLPAGTATELEQVVSKVLGQARRPCQDPAFYAHPVFASGWEPEGYSVMQTETYLGFLEQELGQLPEREYTAIQPGESWPDPDWIAAFGPGGLGYLPGAPDYLTDWGGSAQRINGDINAGAYLVVHRGIGYEAGWGDPAYDVGDVAGLTNLDHPIVFSLEALCGRYDGPQTCLTEALLRTPHGALGVVSASGITYAQPMRRIGLYLIDALWPVFLPDSGPDVAESRPAFALAAAKHALAEDTYPLPPMQKAATCHVLHYHGEPYTLLHDSLPRPLVVEHDLVCPLGGAELWVGAEEGARIGITQAGVLLGYGHGTGGPQTFPLDPLPQEGVLVLRVTRANRLPYQVEIPVLPVSGIDDWMGDHRRVASSCTLVSAGPNPTAARSRILFELRAPAQVSCRFFSTDGSLVRAVGPREFSAGRGELSWDGLDQRGRPAAPGVYLFRLKAGAQLLTGRVTRLP